MLYLIFENGVLVGVSTDGTNASQIAQQLFKDNNPDSVRVIRVNGGIHEELYADDRNEE